MKTSAAVNMVGLLVAGVSGGFLAEELLDADSPNVLIPVIGLVAATLILFYGFSLRKKER